jgi:hypothetical protein
MTTLVELQNKLTAYEEERKRNSDEIKWLQNDLIRIDTDIRKVCRQIFETKWPDTPEKILRWFYSDCLAKYSTSAPNGSYYCIRVYIGPLDSQTFYLTEEQARKHNSSVIELVQDAYHCFGLPLPYLKN